MTPEAIVAHETTSALKDRLDVLQHETQPVADDLTWHGSNECSTASSSWEMQWESDE